MIRGLEYKERVLFNINGALWETGSQLGVLKRDWTGLWSNKLSVATAIYFFTT